MTKWELIVQSGKALNDIVKSKRRASTIKLRKKALKAESLIQYDSSQSKLEELFNSEFEKEKFKETLIFDSKLDENQIMEKVFEISPAIARNCSLKLAFTEEHKKVFEKLKDYGLKEWTKTKVVRDFSGAKETLEQLEKESKEKEKAEEEAKEARGKISKLQKEKEELQTRQKELEEEIEENKQTISILEDSENRLKNRISSEQNRIKDLLNAKNILEDEIKTKGETTDEQKKKLEELENLLQEKEGKINKFKEERKEVKNRVKQLISETESVQKEKETVIKEEEKIQSEIEKKAEKLLSEFKPKLGEIYLFMDKYPDSMLIYYFNIIKKMKANGLVITDETKDRIKNYLPDKLKNSVEKVIFVSDIGPADKIINQRSEAFILKVQGLVKKQLNGEKIVIFLLLDKFLEMCSGDVETVLKYIKDYRQIIDDSSILIFGATESGYNIDELIKRIPTSLVPRENRNDRT